MKHLAHLLAVAFLVACWTPPAPPDVGVPLGGSCAAACAHLRELGCAAAAPTPNGASCEVVCENVQASGVLRWNLVCRASAPTCTAIDACEGSS